MATRLAELLAQVFHPVLAELELWGEQALVNTLYSGKAIFLVVESQQEMIVVMVS